MVIMMIRMIMIIVIAFVMHTCETKRLLEHMCGCAPAVTYIYIYIYIYTYIYIWLSLATMVAASVKEGRVPAPPEFNAQRCGRGRRACAA